MNLIFKRGPDAHNDWVYGCPPTWEWEGDGGGYIAGRDFFSVHWQVNIPKSEQLVTNSKRSIIRIHVESPRYEVDRFLNEVKRELVTALLDSNLGQKAIEMGYGYKVGARTGIDQNRGNKSTEALRILIPNRQLRKDDDENIIAVHASVGSIADSLVQTLAKRLNRRFSGS